jgi:hypothetical protein
LNPDVLKVATIQPDQPMQAIKNDTFYSPITSDEEGGAKASRKPVPSSVVK